MTRYLIPVLSLIVLLGSCKKKNTDTTVIEAEEYIADSLQTHELNVDSLPSHSVAPPQVPAYITDEQARIDYITQHYWDNMDFRDEAMTSDLLLVEQTFSNFLAMLHRCSDDAVRETAIRACLVNSSVHRETFDFLVQLSEEYLYDRESPFRNEDMYKLFINNILSSHLPNEREKMRLRDRRHQINIASPGSLAPEMTIYFRDGSATRLTQLIEGTNTMLVFYNAADSDDKQRLQQITGDPKITSAVESLQLKVILLNIGDSASVAPPPLWISASCTDISTLFVTRTSPSTYLIGRDGVILCKDLDVDEAKALF